MTWCHFFCVYGQRGQKGKILYDRHFPVVCLFTSSTELLEFNLKNHISDLVLRQLMSLLGKQGSQIILDYEQSLFSSKIFGKERKTSKHACMTLCINYVFLCVLPQGFSSKRQTISVDNHAVSSSIWN